jgi:long-chain acyl-CoA synthetase
MNDYASRLAASLQRMGVQPGERVALLLPNSPQFIIAYYGLLKLGAVIVPLNPLSSPGELAFYLSDSGAGTLITIPMFASKVTALNDQAPIQRLVVAAQQIFARPLNLIMGAGNGGR